MFSKKFSVILGIILVLAIIAFSFYIAFLNRLPKEKPDFGVTYSTVYAKQLGLNWQDTYLALLQDLGVKKFRIPVYWSEIEKEKDIYNWDELDWLMEKAEENGVEVILVVGQKVPRWPECFVPDWAEKIDVPYTQKELLEFIELTVNRYKDSPAVLRWQIENEAFFPFGVCPKPDYDQFMKEINLVRSLDDRPIQLTVSGELEPWIDAAIPADVLGISMYRVTWNDFFGYFYYPITPGFYRSRALTIAPLVDEFIISELQTEPWFFEPVKDKTPEEWYQIFDEKDMKKNIDFAVRTQSSEVYLWGAEWWYYLKQNGNSALWDVGEEVFR